MSLGTLEDHRHLVLAFLGWWKLTAAQGLLPIFARMCNSTANKIPPVVAYRRYWEANVVGTVRQPCQTEPVIAGIKISCLICAPDIVRRYAIQRGSRW
eukprot:COSAG06_NODE_176_length_21031_cov_66.751290_19_plen_98_part_00